MKRIREAARLVGFNARALLLFELVYKTASSLIFTPLLLGLLDLTMKLRGFSYLTLENVFSFLLSPITLIALILIFLLAAMFAMTDISAVIFALDSAARQKRVTFSQTVRFAVKNAARVWRPKNVLLVPVVLLLLPFVHIGLASGFMTTFSVPEFILDYIKASRVLAPLFLLFGIGLTFLAVRWMYAFYYYTIEGCNFSEARKRSVGLGRGARLRDFGSMLLMQAVFAVVYALAALFVVTAASLLGRLFSGIFILKWLGTTIVWLAAALLLAVMSALTVPVGYGCVGILFYNRKVKKGEAVVHIAEPEEVRTRYPRAKKAFGTAAVCLLAAGSLALGFMTSTGRINPEIEYIRTMEVTAHRGASAFYPENTMAAFRGALALGADWIELDVQQTGDGEIIVIHDSNLRRTTGVNANTWEMSYEEIAKLDAGSYFAPEFAGERIPLLSEVLAFAKESGIKLNIELKPTGHEREFEKGVVELIREAGMAERCVITSQVYESLENVKEYDAGIKTVYVMSIAYGDLDGITAADCFSVEAASAKKRLISLVHNAGKELYVWTVNTEESITRMIELNADNIITDDVELAKKCICDSRYSSLLEEYIKLIS